MNTREYQLMQVLKKIPLFKGFEVKEALYLLRICRTTSFQPGQTIYVMGEPSMEMLILLKGKLNVTGRSGEILAVIDPGGAIGEMGLFTGQPRSANIIAMSNSTGLVIRKQDLIQLLHGNKDMHIKLLNNLVAMLSERLVETDRLVEKGIEKGGEEEDEEEYDEDDEEGDEYDEDEEE